MNRIKSWTLPRLWRQLTVRRRVQFFLVLGMVLVGAVAETLTLGAVLPFLAFIASPNAVRDYSAVRWVFDLGLVRSDHIFLAFTSLFIAAAVFAGVIRVILAWISNKFAFDLGHDLGVKLYERLLYQPYSYHVAHNTSEVIAAITKVQTVTQGMLLPLIMSLGATIIGVFIILALLFVDIVISLIAFLAFFTLYAAVSLIIKERLKKNSELIARIQGERIKSIQEGLGGIRDILIDKSQNVFLRKFASLDAAFRRAQAFNTFMGAAPRYVIEATGMVLIATLALFLSWEEGGVATVLPVLGALAIGAQRLLPLMQLVYLGWVRMAGNVGDLYDILRILEAPMPRSCERVTSGGRGGDLKRGIAFKNVSFRFTPEGAPVVDNLSFEILAGQKVGFVGKTGSGKSTTVDLLMGLLEPTSGTIEIDGGVLDQDMLGRWQRQIAHVPQTIFLSDASFAENIAFGTERRAVDMDQVRLAAHQAELATFIEGLPNGYDAVVGERGVRLSGGQRQRVGIARALYKQANVLFDRKKKPLLIDARQSLP